MRMRYSSARVWSVPEPGADRRHHRRDHTASYLFVEEIKLIQPGKPRLDMRYAPWAMSPPAAERRLRNHNLI